MQIKKLRKNPQWRQTLEQQLHRNRGTLGCTCSAGVCRHEIGVCTVWESVWPGLLCYGLKEPGDTHTARLLREVNVPVSFRCERVHEFVFLCPLSICNQFSSPISQFHLCYFHPLPPLRSTEKATDRLGGQINSPARAAQSAEGLRPPLQLLYLTQQLHIHTPPAFTLWMCTASTKQPEHFFLPLHLHSPQPHSPTSFWSGCLCFFWGFFCQEEAYLGEWQSSVSINENCFGEVAPFLSPRCAGHYNQLVFTQTR